MKVAVLSCGALAREVRSICQTEPWPQQLVFVPPLLHLYPAKLRTTLAERLSALRQEHDQILVLYGQCLPDMDDFLAQYNAHRIRGEHCLEMIGGDRFWAVIKECPGTYFVIPSWVQSFDSALVTGLGLDKEPRMKSLMFRNYKQVVYFDTLLYGNLDNKVADIAAFLELPLRIERRGVETLRTRLAEALSQF